MAPSQPSGRGSPTTPILPPLLAELPADPADKPQRANATTAAYAASVRGVTAQAVAFYFRAPVKAFFRTRVDYLSHVRAIILEEQRLKASVSAATSSSSVSRSFISPTSWLRATTPAVLASAVRKFGWRIVPDHVLPPLIANVAVGAVLYTSYLHVLGRLHTESAQNKSRIYPPPPPQDTLAAGFAAGALQSVVAAPLDAIQARYDVSAIGFSNGSTTTRQSMWAFSVAKLKEIGLRGMFAGWGMSFVKDGFGSALFFSTFEYVKAQEYYRFVEWYYGSLSEEAMATIARKRPTIDSSSRKSPHRNAVDDGDGYIPDTSLSASSSPVIIRPHYALEPMFLLLAGVAASVVQQVVLHPLTHMQTAHWEHLEALDAQAARLRGRPEKYAVASARQWRMVRAYVHAYQETWATCQASARAMGGGISMRSWLYRGFWWSTVRQVPSTSAGLVIFELVRRRYGFKGEQVRIPRGEYDIILD